MVKFNGFVNFFSRLFLFFRVLGQPKSRNFGPKCQGCSLGLDVSRWSRDLFLKCLGLVS